MKERHPQTFCAMIRHGERADNVDFEKMGIEIEEPQDPPMTPDGLHEA